MQPNVQDQLQRQARQAMDTFHRNSDTLVAGFLIRHPDVDPAELVLVTQPVGGSIRFSIERKVPLVPEARHVPEGDIPDDLDAAHQRSANIGWNECRAAMIEMAGQERATAITAPLEAANG